MIKVYVSPSANKKDNSNPYFRRLKKGLSSFCDVLEADNKPRRMQSGALFINSFRADVYLLSFMEAVAFQKLPVLQTFLTLMSLEIIRLRKRTMVFFYHNPVAHKGDNWMCRLLFKNLFSHADYVLTHSENTALIAKEKVGAEKVILFSHPTEPLTNVDPIVDGTDVFIWGTVFPYKGVYEFVSAPEVQRSQLMIKIIGNCPDPQLAKMIHAKTNERIVFEQRRAEMEEIAARIAGCRFVLFPYLAKSISGSASLMDTLKYGGNVIGPDAGAFHDLAEKGLCKVFRETTDLMELLNSDWYVNKNELSAFLDAHIWPEFIKVLHDSIPIFKKCPWN